MNGKKYDIEFFHALAKQKGGKCLSNEYIRLSLKLKWECGKGHVFQLEPQKILTRNYWCAECTGRRTLHTIETIQKISQDRGWKFLSPEYSGGNKKYKFQCDKGHIIYVLADNVIKGVGCRTCAGKQLLTIGIFKKIAEEKEGVCLSEKYEGQKTKLKFRCKEGHIFEAIPGEIKNGGTWCKKCSGLELGTIEEMKKLAESKGGKCLSDKYVNSSTKLKWQCNDHHKWKATPRDVKNNDSWCPYCTWYKQETKCKYILEKLLDTVFHKTRRVFESGLELDGYSMDYNLAFEYNGEQHYEKHFFNNDPNKFEQIKKNDWLKLEECKAKSIELLIIPFDKATTDQDTIEFIKNELGKRKIPFRDFAQEELMKGFYENNSVLSAIRKLVAEKGGRLISNEYVNSQSRLKIVCENNHTWETSYTQLKLGRWCTLCSGLAKGNIVEMHQIAIERKGKCLSVIYINNKTTLLWQCNEGHVWEATPHSIKRGSWCLKCAGNSKLTIEDMKILANEKGGKCLSTIYTNNSTKLKWECAKGHIWEDQPQNVKRIKSWCPYCSGRLRGQ